MRGDEHQPLCQHTKSKKCAKTLSRKESFAYKIIQRRLKPEHASADKGCVLRTKGKRECLVDAAQVTKLLFLLRFEHPRNAFALYCADFDDVTDEHWLSTDQESGFSIRETPFTSVTQKEK